MLASRLSLGVMLLLGGLGCLTGCNSDAGFASNKTPKVPGQRRADGSFDDRSMCQWRGDPQREASEVAGPGSIQPNVRRVYQLVGTGEDRHKVLICREIDTNFDGIKDVVRHYNERGESVAEEADANYDGKIDTWITFVKGRLAEVKLDTNFDGKPDQWKYYSNGKLMRVVRDTNFDGKPDVWEIYRDGKLERMGVDVDGDEHVDRWDHDTEMRRRFEEAERKKEEEAAEKNAARQKAEREANEKDAAADDEPAGKPDPKKKKAPKTPKAKQKAAPAQ